MPTERGDSWFSPKCIEVQPPAGGSDGGRALSGLGAKRWLPPPTKLRMPSEEPVSETAGAKLRRREGNSPDHQLRSRSRCSVSKEVHAPRQPGCWLRSSHHCKECVRAHWSSACAPTTYRGSCIVPKLWISRRPLRKRGHDRVW